MFTTEAFAQVAGGTGSDSGLSTLLSSPVVVLIPVIAIMYFLVMRPQQQKARDHREMVGNLRRGDTVVTAGGLIGKIAKVDEAEVQVELADGVRVKVVRGTIAEVRTRGEPVKDAAQ